MTVLCIRYYTLLRELFTFGIMNEFIKFYMMVYKNTKELYMYLMLALSRHRVAAIH